MAKLNHEIPLWVRDDAVFFVTVCCENRTINSLAVPEIGKKIGESLACRQRLRQWWIIYALAMPDHFHVLLTVPKGYNMVDVIRSWKRFHASKTGIVWQKDLFDHRIRSDESLEEKIEYIRQNPVRKGLVAHPDQWPYAWHGQELDEWSMDDGR